MPYTYFFAFLLLSFLSHSAAQGEVLKDEDLQNFFNQTRGFLIACTQTQIQLSPQTFVGLCKKFTDAATRLCVPIQGVAPLQLAASKLLEGRAKRTLTPIDADVLQLCLLAGTYSIAEKHVDGLHMYEVDPMNTCLTPMDFLRYWYYSGMVRCNLKQWGKAIDCFRIVISSPAHDVSAIVIESYKKLCLTSLIEKGVKPTLPSYTENIVTRALRTQARPYDAIVKKFEDNDAVGLEEEVKKAHDALLADKNLGLAKQAVKALARRRMRRLTDCYITLSLEDIAQQVGLANADEALTQLLWLIKKGLIYATIDQSTRMVHFKDGDNISESAAADALTVKLERSIEEVVDLANRVQELDIQMSKNPKYIMKNSAGGDGRGPIGGASSVVFGLDGDDMGDEAIAISESYGTDAFGGSMM